MLALIDGDVVVYRVGFASENQTEAQNCINAELVMEDILNATNTESYRVFLSDKLENNFRYKIDNSYKANRKDAPKPKYYDSLRLFLQQNYQAEFTPGQEADDALGIAQCTTLGLKAKYNASIGPDPHPYESVICSIDKDLLQIPGRHYNLSTGVHTTVTYIEGLRSFYRQLLIGDRVDNITGITGIGKVKAARCIDHLDNESDMFATVRVLYQDDERLLRNGQLLWVRRTENEMWRFPDVEQSETGASSEAGAA
jgi:5'-3' exonuclease